MVGLEVGDEGGDGDGVGWVVLVTMEGMGVGGGGTNPRLVGKNDANDILSLFFLLTNARVGENGKSVWDRGTGAGDWGTLVHSVESPVFELSVKSLSWVGNAEWDEEEDPLSDLERNKGTEVGDRLPPKNRRMNPPRRFPLGR